jgi:hypothetical protein
MRTFARIVLFALLLMGVFVASADADSDYSYTGDTFTFVQGVYTPLDRIIGDFVLSSSFVPVTGVGPGIQTVTNGVVSYSFTDGHQTLTQDNSTATFQVAFNPDGTPIVPGTDGAGVNGWWYVDIHTPTSEILTESLDGDYQTFASIDDASMSRAIILSINGALYPGSPGTWTVQTVPEGGTTTLFLFANLASLAILAHFTGLKRVRRGR